jgi:hypothetical protein
MSTTEAARVPAIRVEMLMTDKGYAGLCLTCLHAFDCVFLGRATEPVVYCEEFSNQVHLPVQAAANIQVIGQNARAGSPVIGKEGITLNGLCINCTRNIECWHAESGTNILHCEEYE